MSLCCQIFSPGHILPQNYFIPYFESLGYAYIFKLLADHILVVTFVVLARDVFDINVLLINLPLFCIAAKGQGLPRDDILLHADNTDSTLLHLAVESGVAKVIDHFIVVSLVTWSWIVSEAGVDLVLIETSLLFICIHLHKKSSEVSIKTRSTPASLSIQTRTLSTQL